jgi:integrase
MRPTRSVMAAGRTHVIMSSILRGLVKHHVRPAHLSGPPKWTPRDLRHSSVSLLSANGVTLEQIADLCGHAGTTVTEKVYRHELRPVLLDGAVVMDRIFKAELDDR